MILNPEETQAMTYDPKHEARERINCALRALEAEEYDEARTWLKRADNHILLMLEDKP